MASRIVNQSVAVVQRFPYLGMFPSVVRWQFFVDLPDLIDGFRGSVSGSLQFGICTVVVVVVSAIVTAREPWVCISAGLGACQRRQVRRSGMSKSWQSLTVDMPAFMRITSRSSKRPVGLQSTCSTP